MHELVLGIDFGTDSCRAVLIDGKDGKEVASHVAYFKRCKEGRYCDPRKNQFRQHPLDYIETMEEAVQGAVERAGKEAGERVRGIGIDTTGSTPCAADEKGRPLSLQKEYAEDPNAMFVLWKDHTAVSEALEIPRRARTWGGVDYTDSSGVSIPRMVLGQNSSSVQDCSPYPGRGSNFCRTLRLDACFTLRGRFPEEDKTKPMCHGA